MACVTGSQILLVNFSVTPETVEFTTAIPGMPTPSRVILNLVGCFALGLLGAGRSSVHGFAIRSNFFPVLGASQSLVRGRPVIHVASMTSGAITAEQLSDIIEAPWSLPDGGLGNAKADEVFRFLQANPITLPGQPMRYEPLNVMARVTNRPFASSPAFTLKPEDFDCTPGAEDIRACYCAVLQLACGGLDECHDRITPFSWDSGTLFGGPPVFDSAARSDATYIHHMVHMREGQHPGEFGTGWNNAGFWAGSVGEHPTLPQVEMAAAAIASQLGPSPPDLVPSTWSMPAFIKCCSAAVASNDPALTAYCERVVNVQYRLLLNHLRSKL